MTEDRAGHSWDKSLMKAKSLNQAFYEKLEPRVDFNVFKIEESVDIHRK